MREIIQLNFGQTGCRVAEQYWQAMLREHELTNLGRLEGERDTNVHNPHVLFNEISNQTQSRFVPRSIFADTDSRSIDNIQCGLLGRLYNPDLLLSSNTPSRGSCSEVIYEQDPDFFKELQESLRSEAEKCDGLSAIQIVAGLSGGAGSGLTVRAIEHLEEEYGSQVFQTIAVLPHRSTALSVPAVLNSVIALGELAQSSYVHLYENNALERIVSQMTVEKTHDFRDVNDLVATTMSALTGVQRLQTTLSTDLRKLYSTLVPFPQTSFLFQSITPTNFHGIRNFYMELFDPNQSIDDEGRMTKENEAINSMVNAMYLPRSFTIANDPNYFKYVSSYAIFRGDFSTSELMNVSELQYLTSKRDKYCSWISDGMMTCHSKTPIGSFLDKSAVFFGQNGIIFEVLRYYRDMLTKIMARKAYIEPFQYAWVNSMGENFRGVAKLDDVCEIYEEMIDYDEYSDGLSVNDNDDEDDESWDTLTDMSEYGDDYSVDSAESRNSAGGNEADWVDYDSDEDSSEGGVLSQIPVDAENDHDDPGSDDTDESIDLNQKKKLINGKDVRNAKNHGTEEAKSEESEEASPDDSSA
eukprot:CAMPEP_0115001432 /NCGR_PEP_ID=MMETSP0216-20121206/17372_1 /TAXON_ID=223996 /ORGANISM="Protocruzia adherens, Strain Boccale" /LENGTH=581 /DNA_ID=CAMNT_0002366765 /DNA_START=140 /DNA_END=1886 /DNA_ORIENTATION=+